jgi:hypothetical protein
MHVDVWSEISKRGGRLSGAPPVFAADIYLLLAMLLADAAHIPRRLAWEFFRLDDSALIAGGLGVAVDISAEVRCR